MSSWGRCLEHLHDSIKKRDHPFSKYLKVSEELQFFTPLHTHLRARIKNVSRVRSDQFSENFAYVLNE